LVWEGNNPSGKIVTVPLAGATGVETIVYTAGRLEAVVVAKATVWSAKS
jgi:hypothetical protein